RALVERDVNAIKHWATELATAAFGLDDLHRWLDFLLNNQLLALRFQSQCESLFSDTERSSQHYDPQSTMSQYPAGILSLNGWGNYYELERQAERLFSMPADRLEEIARNTHLTAGSRWVP